MLSGESDMSIYDWVPSRLVTAATHPANTRHHIFLTAQYNSGLPRKAWRHFSYSVSVFIYDCEAGYDYPARLTSGLYLSFICTKGMVPGQRREISGSLL